MIGRIPVLLSHEGGMHRHSEPIGFGVIDENGDLIIKVVQELVIGRVEHLAKLGEIKELYLGMGWVPAAPIDVAIEKSEGP